jgi:centromere-localized protein 2
MEQAIADIEDEIVELEKETQSTFADVQATVGDLSDLRYGRFSKTPRVSGRDLSTEVSEGLWRIQQLCEDAGKG